MKNESRLYFFIWGALFAGSMGVKLELIADGEKDGGSWSVIGDTITSLISSAWTATVFWAIIACVYLMIHIVQAQFKNQ